MEDTDPMIGGSYHRLRLEARNWETLSSLLKLTLHNASTFACNYLLEPKGYLDDENSPKGEIHTAEGVISVKMYLTQSQSGIKQFCNRTEKALYLEQNAPKRTLKRIRSKKKEFIREIGASMLD
jgi:hypothetical protein